MGRRSEEKRAKVGVKATRSAIEPPDGDQAGGAEIPDANYGHEPLLPPGIEQWLRAHGVELGICLFLAVATLAVFGRTVWHDFVTYDDGDYVYQNRHVKEGLTPAGIRWAFTQVHSANRHPLTTLSHMLDWSLYQRWAGGHHLTNLLLHAAASVVLFLALRRLTGAVWRSGIVAALFCLHPLHVESVAWVSERKDVLSGLFFGLTLWAYAGYAERPFSWARYLGVVVLFALGLLCKPMLVTLPFLLLLLDYWPLGRWDGAGSGRGTREAGRGPGSDEEEAGSGDEPKQSPTAFFPVADATGSPFRRLLAEKLPLMALSAASCVVTYRVQRSAGAMVDVVTPVIRLQTAILAYARYLGMMLWPGRLAAMYPRDRELDVTAMIVCGLVLAGISAAVLLWNRRGGRYALVGWLWYVGMLVPVCGLVAIGDQSMADRYTYLPLTGIFLALVWGAAELLGRRGATWGVGLATVLLVLCALGSIRQTGYWRDSVTLYEHALAVTPENSRAHTNLGIVFLHQGNKDAAAEQFREALRINPRDSVAYNNAGIVEREKGNLQAAVQDYTAALEINPNFALAHSNLAVAYAALGRMVEAEQECLQALQIDPDSFEAESNLGRALAEQGRYQEAVPHYRRAIDLNPGRAKEHLSLGLALAAQGSVAEAIAEYKTALQIDPDYIDGHNELAKLYHRLGRLQGAVDEWTEVLQRVPGHVAAAKGLGMVLVKGGRGADAVPLLKVALALEPRDLETRKFKAFAHLAAKQPREAVGEFREILRRDPKNQGIREWTEVLRRMPGQAAAAKDVGVALCKMGRGADAVGLLQVALAAEPKDLETREFRAFALVAAGQPREAVSEFREILRQDPENPRALNALAWIEATHVDAAIRKGKEAVELARKAAAQQKTDVATVLDTLAAAYAEAGRFKEAVETARRAKKAAEPIPNHDALLRGIDARLKLYESGKPYRDAG